MRHGLVALITVVVGSTSAAPAQPAAPARPHAEVSLDDARPITTRPGRARQAEHCADVACLLQVAHGPDPRASRDALALWRSAGVVAGVGPREVMDGGYRGTIVLEPRWPHGTQRKHLGWARTAWDGFDRFFARIIGTSGKRLGYRWHGLELRFLASRGKRTPSAYAMPWLIAYNVRGSLMTSADRVAETLFHEIFHANDAARADWSGRTLRADYQAIVDRCGTDARCLAPFAPGTTKVRATGMYYAFQSNNGDGVHEYAAELAVRYWREHQAWFATGRLPVPAFKCGPPENARAWQALIDEFFAGIDHLPACP